MLLNVSGMLMDDWNDLAKVFSPVAAAAAVGVIWKGAKGIWTVSSQVTKITEGMEHQAEKMAELADAFEKSVEASDRRFDHIEKRLQAVERQDN